jgi:tetratricopeptide (TPR) repeat protein
MMEKGFGMYKVLFLALSGLAVPVLVHAQPASPALSVSSDARALMDKGKKAFGAADYVTAADFFKKAYLADSNLLLAQYNYAFALRKAGQFDDARGAYLDYLKVAPKDLDGIFGWAETERLIGNEDAAGKAFAEYLSLENRTGKESYISYARKFAAQPKSETEGSDTVEGLVSAGDKAYKERKFQEAARLFGQAFSMDKTRTDILLRKALAERKGKSYPDAIESYSTVVKMEPKNWDGLFGLAETFRLANRKEEALATFKSYLNQETRTDRASYVSYAQKQVDLLKSSETQSDAQELFDKGMKSYKAKDYPSAISLFNAAIKADPELTKAIYRRALTFRKMKSFDDARASYILFLEKVPNDPDAIYGLATTEKKAGNVPGARKYFAEYIVLEKRPSEAKYVAKAQKYLDDTAPAVEPQGVTPEPVPKTKTVAKPVPEPVPPASEVATNDGSQTVQDSLEPEVKADNSIPKDLRHHHHEGPAKLHASQTGQALAVAKMIRLGELLLDQYQNPLEATQYFHLALSMSPDDQNALVGAGRAYSKQGRTKEAREAFAKAIQVDESSKAGLRAKSLLGSLGPAALMARTPTPKEKEESRIAFAAGTRSLEEGQVQDAVKLLEAAVAYDPFFWDGYMALGDALIAGASVARSVKAYRRAASLSPEKAEPIWKLAQAYEKMGEIRTSRHHYQLVMRSEAKDATPALKRQAWLKLEGAI